MGNVDIFSPLPVRKANRVKRISTVNWQTLHSSWSFSGSREIRDRLTTHYFSFITGLTCNHLRFYVWCTLSVMFAGLSRSRQYAVISPISVLFDFLFSDLSRISFYKRTFTLLLTSAIVDDKTVQIDKALERFGDTQDKAVFNGKFLFGQSDWNLNSGIPILCGGEKRSV